MDALEFIVEDHERFRELLDRYDGLEAPADKRELVDELIARVVRHGVMEESAFYPVVMDKVPAAEGDIREEIEEHHVLEVIMAELADLDAGHDQFDAKVEVFEENLLHHLEEEEEELFPVLRRELDAAFLEELTDDLRTARDGAPSTPDPDRVGA